MPTVETERDHAQAEVARLKAVNARLVTALIRSRNHTIQLVEMVQSFKPGKIKHWVEHIDAALKAATEG